MARNRRNDEDVQVDVDEQNIQVDVGKNTVRVRLSASSPINLLYIGNHAVSRTQSAIIGIEDYERLAEEYGLEAVPADEE